MARPTKHEARYKNVGRKTKITPEVLKKLEEAAAFDATVAEMCFYAEISPTTYYTYCDKNPQFLGRIAELREKPVLLARQTVVKSLSEPVHAFRYLERKRSDEFSEKSKVEHSGSVGNDDGFYDEDDDVPKKFNKEYRKNMHDRIKKS